MLKYTRDENEPGIKGFFRKYINFRAQKETKFYLKEFLLIFIVGIVLSYFYNGSFSLYSLFIGGANELINTVTTLLSGVFSPQGVIFLIIAGMYYALFYYYFVMIIFSIFSNLDDRDTWVMSAWLILIALLANWLIPKVFGSI